MAQKDKLFINTDTDVKIDLYEDFTGDEVIDATVAAQFYTEAGLAQGSAVSMEFQSVATYKGVFPATALVEGDVYYAIITVTLDGGTVKQVKRWFKAAYDDGE